MKKLFIVTLIILFFHYCYAQEQFQLAPPVLKYSSVFFTEIIPVTLLFGQTGTQIFFTLNGKEPMQKDAIYSKTIQIKKSLTTLKAKVFGKDFLPSETVQAKFIKDGLKIKSIQQPVSDEKFPGIGVQTLFDNEGGIADLHDKNFLGYQADSIEINIVLEKKEKIDSVLLNLLQDHGSWIFLPQEISVFYFDGKKKKFEFMAKNEIASDSVFRGSSTIFKIVRAGKKISSDQLKIIIQPLQSMPQGHPGEGKQSWLFIDEIKIY